MKSFTQSLRLLSRRDRAIFLALVGFRLASQILDVVALAAVGFLVALFASRVTSAAERDFLGFSLDFGSNESILLATLGVGGLFIFKSVFSLVFLRMQASFLADVTLNESMRVANWIFSGDLTRIRSMSRAELQWAVASSPSVAFAEVLTFGATVIVETGLFLALFGALVIFEPTTAAVLALYLAGVLVAFYLTYGRQLDRVGQTIRDTNIAIGDSLLTLITCFREAVVVGRKSSFLLTLREAKGKQVKAAAAEKVLNALPRFYVESALILGTVVLILWQFVRGNLAEGLVVVGVFIAGGLRMMAALLPMQGALSAMKTLAPQAEKAHKILRAASESESFSDEANDPSADNTPAFVPLDLDVRDLEFFYPEQPEPAVRDVSLSIRPGEFAAIIGPSGAGKSTLADVILGVLEPRNGEARTSGRLVSKQTQMFPGSVAYVPQKPGMVGGTIAQNVAFGIPKEQIDYDRVQESLELASLSEAVGKLPEGLNASLGSHADAFSGGQLQRLGIARALYPRPGLILFDEATSALDAETESRILDVLRGLRGKVTVLTIAHRLATIREADVVFYMQGGCIVDKGTFPELRARHAGVERAAEILGM